MSADVPPPPPSGPPPSSPPPSGPSAGPPAGARSRLPWLVGGGVVLLLLVVVVLVVTLTGSKAAKDARSVQDVADIAVDAAQDLDVDAGIDLLCSAPSDDERRELQDLIDEGRQRAGTDDPDVDYQVSDVEGDATGSFQVRVSSDEAGLEDQEFSVRVNVSKRGERSCIESFAPGDGD